MSKIILDSVYLGSRKVSFLYIGSEKIFPKSFTITFNLNGLSGTPPNSIEVEEGKYIKDYIPTFSLDNYRIYGWLYGDILIKTGNYTRMPSEDITLYLSAARYYNVTIDLNGATGSYEPIRIPQGEKVMTYLSNFIIDCYVINGFEYNATPVDDTTIMPANDIVVKLLHSPGNLKAYNKKTNKYKWIYRDYKADTTVQNIGDFVFYTFFPNGGGGYIHDEITIIFKDNTQINGQGYGTTISSIITPLGKDLVDIKYIIGSISG